MTDIRNDLAKARDEWIESADFRISIKLSASRIYLHQQLISAFENGWYAKAREKSQYEE